MIASKLTLLYKVVTFVIYDPLQILNVDVARYQDYHIIHVAWIGKDDFADILTVTTDESRPRLMTALIGHYFLIGAVPIKILDAIAELIANISTASTQVKHLHRINAYAGFR